MRAFRSFFFITVGFFLLVAVALTDTAVAAEFVNASSVAAVVPGVDAGVAVSVEGVEQSTIARFLDALPVWVQALSLLVSAFAAIAAITPTPKDDGVLLVLRKIVDFLALNFGGAKNAASKNPRDIS